MFKHTGFTLIELLVVVLIIGVLSAVALPQYQKAVWKSRTTQLITLAQQVAQAQERYFMANGTWPEEFPDLDIGFDFLKKEENKNSFCVLGHRGEDSMRIGENFNLLISNMPAFKTSAALFSKGPYKCGGFMYLHNDNTYQKKLYC